MLENKAEIIFDPPFPAARPSSETADQVARSGSLSEESPAMRKRSRDSSRDGTLHPSTLFTRFRTLRRTCTSRVGLKVVGELAHRREAGREVASDAASVTSPSPARSRLGCG